MKNKVLSIFILSTLFLGALKVHAQDIKAVNISRAQLLAIGKIELAVDSSDFNFDVEYKVVSYIVSAVIAGYSIEIRNIGSKFSEETISLIKRLKRGQKIYFENIKVKYPDDRIKVIDPLIFKLM